jgi:hypothetical protein
MNDRTEAKRAYDRVYWAAHREEKAAYYRAHRAKQNAFARAHPEYGLRYRERHAEEIRARGRAERAGDPEKFRARGKAYRDANPDRVRAMSLRVYSITPERYEAMLAAQGGRCAICRRPEKALNRNGVVMQLHVDHDHRCCPGGRSCGKCVRGLLCHACNSGGGKFGDDPALLRAAADYFEVLSVSGFPSA